MSNYTISIKNSAKTDLKKIQKSQLKSQFLKIVETLKLDPYYPNQSFEKLQPKHLGRYSRRINHQHRVVYTVDDEQKEVVILSAWSHYE
ncbi:Txe/YoeB family addiction module toxin [Staphylococcus intermedius]|uniref:Endoribonuclease YoeB n=1 Tax=Staphylococcus intermedius NCTC 11048 TaxID=1141106 RepID=A0A380FZX5_STAIN|nr:Txe/YoeB family addiction module toxin [Staphylococcus intermedius]PCF62239.1 addiction module protein [Staphylococcus intermedius]PCF77731.1 addiction module protein [Staphylococcus intermedius]PCF77905.1 addiction module protein [Staphylococcus intermedius]PCF83755.1 addiction module protein [Staphylococcus intermedius]PCF84686.1 addiction module protein [Staphylococcus intermedius]